jgi:hypothetical protein
MSSALPSVFHGEFVQTPFATVPAGTLVVRLLYQLIRTAKTRTVGGCITFPLAIRYPVKKAAGVVTGGEK